MKDYKQQQVELLGGSEAIYNRVDRKLAEGETDKLFYVEQLRMSKFRYNYMRKYRSNVIILNYGELDFLITQTIFLYPEITVYFLNLLHSKIEGVCCIRTDCHNVNIAVRTFIIDRPGISSQGCLFFFKIILWNIRIKTDIFQGYLKKDPDPLLY